MAKAAKKKSTKNAYHKYVQPATFEDKSGGKKTVTTTDPGQ
jgi:hypothetical protein